MNNTEKQKTGQNRVATIVKLAEGESFTGKYLGNTTRDYTDKTFNHGEIIELKSYVFQLKDGKRIMYRADAGFKTAFESALVQVGENVTIKKISKLDIDEERSVNQYEIFEA